MAKISARVWCAALLTWGVAAVGGMGVAVYAPGVLPQIGPLAAPAGATAVPASPVAATATGTAAGAATTPATTPAAIPDAAAPATPTPTPTVTVDTAPGARQRAADNAVFYAQQRGWRSGIAIKDLQTGETTYAGDAAGYFRTESTVKLFMAAHLLADGTMASVEPTARRMITLSDDAAANTLYARAGGDGLVAWVGSRYGIANPGTGPVRGPARWGSTQVTPAAMTDFLFDAYYDSRVGPWLVDAMVDMQTLAADGTNQMFGLRAADTMAVVKQGWGGDDDPRDVESTPSVGYVDKGRYAVSIYTLRLPETTLAESQSVVTEQAKILLPRGKMPRS